MNALTDAAPAALAAYAIPASYLLASATAGSRRPFAIAELAAATAFVLSLGVAALTALSSDMAAASSLGLRLDTVTSVMLVLVTFVGLVIVRYSRTYLDGDPGRQRYSRWLMATLAAVAMLVSTAHLGLLAASWTATSLALHQLLTFFKNRPAAQVAAHKKFLVSRLADLCLWTGIAVVYGRVGSLWLSDVEAWLATVPPGEALPAPMQLTAVLFVIAACLKSAQLPFHGWLTQVMEAPTPVSALLHAGVVNIGGFLMIRMCQLMALAPSAQLLLVVVGLTTTVLAALIMTTRVSVKVGLAWSTCAQMGLMLVQCGLGLWHLALLHLVAHSLYKAHAFLVSGSTVEEWRTLALLPKASAARWRALLPRAALVVGLYLGWHVAAGAVLTFPEMGADHAWLAGSIVGAGILGLALVQLTLERAPQGLLARKLHPWLFAGFYLDELFTRLTFRVWPPKPVETDAPSAIPVT